jgi:hypothetical protein
VQIGTAVFGQEANQARGLSPVHGVIDKTPGATRADQAGAGQRFEVMRERRARHFEPPPDLVDAIAVRTGADQDAKDFEPIFLSKCAELRDPLFHYDISGIIELSTRSRGAASNSGAPVVV